MTPSNHNNNGNGNSRPAGMTQDDIYFTLFRHKWLILGFICLGIVGAIAVRVIRPPLYMSRAKLMIHYVVNTTKPDPANPGEQVLPTEPGGQSIINSEVEILKSLDVATNVAAIIGPQRVLAKVGGGNSLMAAAGVIGSGILVEPPRTSILTISFQ